MEELTSLLGLYYEEIGIVPNGTRQDDQVFARSAMMVAMRKYMTLMQIGRIFGKDHSTAHHANKKHEENYNWSEMYRFFYKTAQQMLVDNPSHEVRSANKLTAIMTRQKMYITELEHEVNNLNKRCGELVDKCRTLEKNNKNQYADRV
tara:strand:+ start:245 stop:688 length:444 start_codon:yes stop_codon:yes gene_type:complete